MDSSSNKREECKNYMLTNPPQENETGYYDVVAEKFGYKNGEVVRQIAKEAGVKNVRMNVQANRTPESLPETVERLVKKQRDFMSVELLSTKLNVGVGQIRDAIKALEKQGKNLHITDAGIRIADEVPKAEPSKIHIPKSGKWISVGACGDNHMGSRYERLDVLDALYDLYEAEGITTVYNTGNMIDGEARFNKFDIHKYGMDAQVDWFIERYPKRKGITTYFITGDDHEGWYIQREGVNIGKYIELKAREAGRTDLVFLGHMEHDIAIKAPKGETVLRVIHPGGGSSYATSYTSQKIVESYQGGEKPDIIFGGHYHKAEYCYPREVHFVQTGCTMDQSPFMRKKKIQAHVGGWIVRFTQREDGSVQRFQPEWIPFFDKGYYDKAWKYKH